MSTLHVSYTGTHARVCLNKFINIIAYNIIIVSMSYIMLYTIRDRQHKSCISYFLIYIYIYIYYSIVTTDYIIIAV